ncbi:MAG: L,D-transpeptidase, partial [Gaiellaceae bacterium]
HRLGGPNVAYAAVVRRPTRAYRQPGRRRITSFGRVNLNDVPTVFGVLGWVSGRGCRAAWYHVQLPIRPNGITGFVRARDLQIFHVRTRIVIDISSRRLQLFRGHRRLISTSIAVGSSATPTPTGRYYVNQRFLTDDPSGPYGPAAIGVSAYSPVLIHWAQGGPIGIHGTNAPWSIGRPVSNGCIRLHNSVMRRLFRVAVEGTPVLIRR